jgi:hypothetical protein
MANRPCKPDADTKRLWQMLMPGVAMPSCGTAQNDRQKDDRQKDESGNSATANNVAAESDKNKPSERR